MLDAVGVLLTAAHLLVMHVAAVGPLVAWCVAALARRRGNDAAAELAAWLARASLQALVVGIVLGSVAAGLLWLGEGRWFFDALLRLTVAKLWFAAAEILFSLLLMGWMTWCWKRCVVGGVAGRWGLGLAALLSSTNLLYHFPPLFVVLHLPQFQALPQHGATASVFREFIYRPDVMALTLHHWLAAVATTGVVLLVKAYRLRAPVVGGARLALGATLLQIPVGIAVLTTTPEQGLLLGGDGLASVLFLAGLATALSLMHVLAALALGERDAGVQAALVQRAMILLAVTTVLMLAAQHRGRGAEVGSRKSEIGNRRSEIGDRPGNP